MRTKSKPLEHPSPTPNPFFLPTGSTQRQNMVSLVSLSLRKIFLHLRRRVSFAMLWSPSHGRQFSLNFFNVVLIFTNNSLPEICNVKSLPQLPVFPLKYLPPLPSGVTRLAQI